MNFFLFQKVIKESLYNVLRTQEKLGNFHFLINIYKKNLFQPIIKIGYVVSSYVNKFGGVSGVEIIVQSDRSPGYLNKRIENFLNTTKVFF